MLRFSTSFETRPIPMKTAMKRPNSDIAASPVNANELYAGCLRIFRSTNGGASWMTGSEFVVDGGYTAM